MKLLLVSLLSLNLYSADWKYLDNIIFDVTQKHGVEFNLMKSLIITESNGELDAKSVTNDYGLTQISQLQININKFDRKRLLIDPKYAVECSIKLLKMHCGNKYIQESDRCWEKYHSKTPKFRRKYSKKVRDTYKKLKNYTIVTQQI